MKVVVYARVSTKEQEKEGYSIPAQLKKIKEYTRKRGHEIVAEFVDAESAKQAGRTNFNEMIKFIKENKEIEGIISHKVDRLCRNFKDFVTVDELGVKPLFVEEEFSDNAAGKLTFGMKVLLAKHYIDNLSDEVKKGLYQKIGQGEYPGKAPVGYLNNKEIRRINIDPIAAPKVKQLFECYASGEHSLDSIAKEAKLIGLRSRNGNILRKSAIHWILTNPFYIGKFIWNGQICDGIHQPIIDTSLFERVQHRLSDRYKSTRVNRTFAFSRFIKCHCGYSFSAELKKRKYIYYRCGKTSCHNVWLREEELEEMLGRSLKGVQIDHDTVIWIQEALKIDYEEERRKREKLISDLQIEASKRQEWIDKSYLDKIEGRITETFWKRMTERWEKEKIEISAKLEAHQNHRNWYEEGVKILELANRAYLLYLRQDSFEKRKLLNYVISNCVIDGGNLRYDYKKPFNFIAEGVKNAGWWGLLDLNQ